MSLRTASLALAAGLTCAAPAIALAAPTAPTHTPAAHVERAERATVPRPAASADAAQYADREAQSGQAASYEGGSVVIVLSGGALLVLLLVALLIA